MTTVPTVLVVGLEDFRRELRKLEGALGKEMGAVNQAAVAPILPLAQQRAASGHGKARAAAAKLRASKNQRNAIITLGGARQPWALGAEFGSVRYTQFRKWRGNQFTDAGNVGYFLHPAIREDKENFEDRYLDAIEKLAARAFPD